MASFPAELLLVDSGFCAASEEAEDFRGDQPRPGFIKGENILALDHISLANIAEGVSLPVLFDWLTGGRALVKTGLGGIDAADEPGSAGVDRLNGDWKRPGGLRNGFVNGLDRLLLEFSADWLEAGGVISSLFRVGVPGKSGKRFKDDVIGVVGRLVEEVVVVWLPGLLLTKFFVGVVSELLRCDG